MTTHIRRSHTKSRLGCKNCKQRKMKCDEVHPYCGNCKKRQMQCDFSYESQPSIPQDPVMIERPKKRVVIKEQSPSPDTSSTLASIPPGTKLVSSSSGGNDSAAVHSLSEVTHSPEMRIKMPSDRLFELKLFHHFGLIYCLPPSQRTASGNAWCLWQTNLAFQNENLMDAMLGFAASHFRHLNPLDENMARASHRYMLKALHGHAKDLRDGINEKNAEAIFATSTLIAVHSSMSQRLFNESALPPMHWFHPYQGIIAVLKAGWQWIQHSSIEPVLTQPRDGITLRHFLEPQDPSNTFSTRGPFDFLLEGIDGASLDDREAYESTVSILNYLELCSEVGQVLRFPALVCRRYVTLVEEKDPRALAIVGYFFMIMKKLDRRVQDWWLQGLLEREFKSIMELLPRSWWPKMGWAASVFDEGKRRLCLEVVGDA